MKKHNMKLYFVLVVVYVATSIHYILGRIYVLGLLPQPIKKMLTFFYYKEAAGIKLLIAMAVLLLLTIVIVAAYGKFLSRITLTLSSTLVIPPLIYIAVRSFGDNKTITMWIIVCIIHTIATAVFLIKDARQLNKE